MDGVACSARLVVDSAVGRADPNERYLHSVNRKALVNVEQEGALVNLVLVCKFMYYWYMQSLHYMQ